MLIERNKKNQFFFEKKSIKCNTLNLLFVIVYIKYIKQRLNLFKSV